MHVCVREVPGATDRPELCSRVHLSVCNASCLKLGDLGLIVWAYLCLDLPVSRHVWVPGEGTPQGRDAETLLHPRLA